MIDLSNPLHLLAYVVMAAGLAFDIVGCIGLVRLPDVYNRLQAGTKCVTLGTFLILLGVVLRFGFGSMGWKALLCLWFIAMTSPTAAHAIARAAHRAGYRPVEGLGRRPLRRGRRGTVAPAAARRRPSEGGLSREVAEAARAEGGRHRGGAGPLHPPASRAAPTPLPDWIRGKPVYDGRRLHRLRRLRRGLSRPRDRGRGRRGRRRRGRSGG